MGAVVAVQLNHTIVHAKDKRESARFVADLFGLGEPKPYGPFLTVAVANGVTLDYLDQTGDITSQHYAFLVTEPEFDAIFARIQAAGVTYYADPFANHPGQINTNDGGRGCYFADPSGHWLEIITVPYGGG